MSQEPQMNADMPSMGGMGANLNFGNGQDLSWLNNAAASSGMMPPSGAPMMGAPQNQPTAQPPQSLPQGLPQGMPGAPPMDQQQHQQQPNMNFNTELKRLQQLQQFNGQAANPNALLSIGQQQAMSQQAMLLQSMFDQKVQNPRFDANAVFNPMFQPGLMQDARLLMAQTQFPMAMAMQNMGEVPLPSPHSLFHRDGSRRMRGGVIEPFPEKLHRLLLEVEAAGRSDVISFVANGQAFAIHKPDKFFKEIVPLYFRQSRLSSFKRQLNLYGFELINTGPSRGGYFHELFVKDRAELCRTMRRVAVKVAANSNSKDTSGKEEKDTSAPQSNVDKFEGVDNIGGSEGAADSDSEGKAQEALLGNPTE